MVYEAGEHFGNIFVRVLTPSKVFLRHSLSSGSSCVRHLQDSNSAISSLTIYNAGKEPGGVSELLDSIVKTGSFSHFQNHEQLI